MIGSLPARSLARQDRRPHARQRSRIELESLEGRDLMSNIPGVSLHWGNLAITATHTSGNVAVVQIDPSTQKVEVTLNGNTEEFAAGLVANITYKGGSGGSDSFTDDTSLVSLDYGYGGNNTFTGGSSYNYVYFHGSGNTYNAQYAGSISDVFENGGTGDTIRGPGTVYTYH